MMSRTRIKQQQQQQQQCSVIILIIVLLFLIDSISANNNNHNNILWKSSIVQPIQFGIRSYIDSKKRIGRRRLSFHSNTSHNNIINNNNNNNNDNIIETQVSAIGRLVVATEKEKVVVTSSSLNHNNNVLRQQRRRIYKNGRTDNDDDEALSSATNNIYLVSTVAAKILRTKQRRNNKRRNNNNDVDKKNGMYVDDDAQYDAFCCSNPSSSSPPPPPFALRYYQQQQQHESAAEPSPLVENSEKTVLASYAATAVSSSSSDIIAGGKTSSSSSSSSSSTTFHNNHENDDDINNNSNNAHTVQQVGAIRSKATASRGRGGSASVVALRSLMFWETMVCGAISRSVAQTVMHPANTMKTLLQQSSSRSGGGAYTLKSLVRIQSLPMLTRGAGANFLLSVPHGAVNFAVLEYVRHKIGKVVDTIPLLERNKETIGPGLDFVSSAISTITCSVVSTPQMMIIDNIMAGNYKNLPTAITGLAQSKGIVGGFYAGWLPGLVGKIPSYALTWTLFQQAKRIHYTITQRQSTDIENSIMGALASATTVCIMIPMDTIKTRLVTQAGASTVVGTVAYKGIIDCAVRVAKEEGMGAFYRGLPPRLVSVVPMIGIQFGVYEYMKKVMLSRNVMVGRVEQQPSASVVATRKQQKKRKRKSGGKAAATPPLEYGKEQELLEAAMEIASSDCEPEPAPHFHGYTTKQ